MDNRNCLNCGQVLSGNYCVDCGQRASTHRFTLKHIFSHDLVHGLFHLDKGFLFTAKELVTRPGYSIREYIEGRRSQHFNYITFMLLAVAFNLFILVTSDMHWADLYNNMGGSNRDLITQMQRFQQKYMKELYLLAIPLYSFVTCIIFRNSRKNYAEHLVMNTYKEGGALFVYTVLLLIIVILIQDPKLRVQLYFGFASINIVYNSWFYFQFFRRDNPNTFLLVGKISLVFILGSILETLIMLPFVYFFMMKH